MDDLITKLLGTSDVDEAKEIVDMFNLDIKKKDVIRASKYSDILDKITSQIDTRLTFSPDSFSNRELIEYIKTMQGSLKETLDTAVETIPTIQINKNELNFNLTEDTLNRESRERIAEAIKGILNDSNVKQILDVENFEEQVNTPENGDWYKRLKMFR